MTGVALLVGVAVIVFVVATSPRTPDAGAALIRPPDNPASTYASGDNGEATGRADAPVVLDVYSDFQCPACGKFAKEVLPGLVHEFVPSGQLRIVDHAVDILSRTDPPESTLSAVAATCAGRQGKYWAFHDYLFWNQRGENQGAFSAARLAAIADAVGVDRGQWDACIADPAVADAIHNTTTSAGINQTPTFALNGQRVTDLQSFPQLADRIRALVPAASASGSAASAAPSASAAP